MKALYIICRNQELDIVGYNVCNYLFEHYDLDKETYYLGSSEVYKISKDTHEYYFLMTDDFVMHNTAYYLDFLCKHFSDVEAAVHVNYHLGATAPDPVLTVHHVGDIMSGTYLPYNPTYATNLLVNMERLRTVEHLDTYTCVSETTHYSGVVSNIDPKLLMSYPINNIDIEIGSQVASLSNKKAVKVVSETLFEIFNDTQDTRLNILYIGGAHFETTYTNAILNQEFPIYLAHQLCGLWISQVPTDQLEDNIRNIIAQSTLKYDAIVYHEKTKKLKPMLENIAKDLSIQVYKYNALKNMGNSELKKLYLSKNITKEVVC